MSSVVIDVSELRDVEGETIKELADFLKKKINAQVNVAGGEITIKPEDDEAVVPKKAYMRVLLRKFLHKTELKEDFRVISTGENVLMIKIRREARTG